MITAQSARRMSREALDFTIRDLRAVIEIQERGVRQGEMHCPKLGQYHDELAICHEELRRRRGEPVCPTCGQGVGDGSKR